MDIATITSAWNGIKIAKDTFTFILNSKIETETRTKVTEALRVLGDAQDQLFQLREELFRLQTENKELKDTLSDQEKWKSKLTNYELTETPGGAVVYKSIQGTEHYACPSCIERKELQILQDRRIFTGSFECPGCGKAFLINPKETKSWPSRSID